MRNVLLDRLEALDHHVDPAGHEALIAVVLVFTTDIGNRRQCQL